MLVETLTGAVFIWLYVRFGVALAKPTAVCIVYAVLCAALIASTFIDFEFRIIPNEITFTGIAAGPIVSLYVPQLHTSRPLLGIFFRDPHSVWPRVIQPAWTSIEGIAISGLVVFGVGWLGKLAFRKDALGFGDVKLMALVGGITGWPVAVIAFFVAPFFGLFMGIPNLVLKGKHVIPYGPFLSLATLVVLSWKPEFISLATGQFWSTLGAK